MATATQATTETETSLDEADPAFVSCGLDRSCPKSVTTPQGQGVRLDQYQSSITGNRNKRRRRQSCIGTTTAAIDTQPFAVIPDHDFEWYDLDAIREADGSNSSSSNNNNNNQCAITVVHHDFNAGLVFTTERQVLGKRAEVNVVNSSTSGEMNGSNDKNKLKKKFFWINVDHDKVEETPFEKEERDFRERMEKLEQEINTDLSSSCSLSGSSLLNHDETKNESDCDDDSDGDFFASWRFGDPVIRWE